MSAYDDEQRKRRAERSVATSFGVSEATDDDGWVTTGGDVSPAQFGAAMLLLLDRIGQLEARVARLEPLK